MAQFLALFISLAVVFGVLALVGVRSVKASKRTGTKREHMESTVRQITLVVLETPRAGEKAAEPHPAMGDWTATLPSISAR